MARDMRRDTAKSGDGNDTKMPWHDYPSFSSSGNEAGGKTESIHTSRAHKPATTQRQEIDVLKRMP